MKPNPLYLVIGPNDETPIKADAAILQLRTNLEWLETPKLVRNHAGELVLRLPEPIIVVAKGHRNDLYGLASAMFGAREKAWKYMGDHLYSYRLGEPVQLTHSEWAALLHLQSNEATLEQLALVLFTENTSAALHETFEIVNFLLEKDLIQYRIGHIIGRIYKEKVPANVG